jgi:DNA repair exonuclease SbcCD ATPase subunit
MEPLTFKIITDADDRGVRQYESSLGKVDTTGKKASGALKGFIADLGNVNSGTDVASSALNAFSRILGGTLIGTAVVVIGKTLVDSFNRVTGAVKEVTKNVEEAQKEIAKVGMAGVSFATASKQADILSASAEKINKEITKINESRLDSFISGLTGSKDKLLELLAVEQQRAKEAQREAIVQGLLELERQQNADAATKAVMAAAEPYQKLIELARQLGNEQLLNTTIIKQQEAAAVARHNTEAEASKKRMEEETKQRENQKKEMEKIAKEEADFELKLIEATAKATQEAHLIEMRFAEERRKADSDRLADISRQIASIQERKKAIEEEIEALLRRNAAESAGRRGSGRGPGQQPSSFEAGLEQQLLRARYDAIRQRDQEYFEFIREQLRSQGKAYDNWAVQNEIAKKAVEEQTQEILKGNEEIRNLQKESKALNEELAKLTKEADTLKEGLKKLLDESSEFGKSLKDSAKPFEIASEDMISSALGAAGGLGSLAESALGGLGSAVDSAKTSVKDFASQLSSLLPSPDAGTETDLATETTLSAVLEMLESTLDELKAYAHAT